ncbi:hypothetical protein FIV07_21235 [Mycobacterium sp. THAF192]|nr:hypothetical protein FIV07_21235 [Mycobacterium sp. THAF192]
MRAWMRYVVEAAAEFGRGIDTASAIRHGVPVAPRGDRSCCGDPLPPSGASTAADAASRN